YFVANSLRLDLAERQELLAIDSAKSKLEWVTGVLARETEVLEIGKRIQTEAQERLTKAQREYYFREQLRPRRKELGEVDEDHYDLEKVKERILEYLAVLKLRDERLVGDPEEKSQHREPILCFVGPPGVGKTSLGQSIAKALGRKFVRMSLGGVRDEAEIRGHRRTYIGALPGRIIQGLRRAETKDPVFMLDEIDKIGADWRGQ